MRTLCAVIFLAAMTTVASAQTPTNAAAPNSPYATVVKSSWSRYTTIDYGKAFRIPSGISAVNTSVTDDNSAFTREVRTGQPIKGADAVRVSAGNVYTPSSGGNRLVQGYAYRATVRNTGSKTIKAIDWDYVFTDPASQVVISRHMFSSSVSIGPGKSKQLFEFTSSSPTIIVSVNNPYVEQVIINRITFSDGTEWVR